MSFGPNLDFKLGFECLALTLDCRNKLPIDTARNLDNEQNDAILVVATNLDDLKQFGVYDSLGAELRLLKDVSVRQARYWSAW